MPDMVFQTGNLTKRYGQAPALDDVSMSIEKGQIYGLVGRNGAGKTTLMRIAAGQILPTQGSLSLFGSTDLESQRGRIGAIVEIPSFYPYLTARQNLEYYRIQRGIPGKGCVEEALEQVRLTDTGKKTFKTFSLGMKQRLGLALALMGRPEVLLLDEPINGLDPEGIVEFRGLLLELNRQRGTTILISSHILTELSNLATVYGFMDKGRLLEQISAEDLHAKCRACLQLTVTDAARAAAVLERDLGLRDFEVLPGQVLRLYSYLEHPQRITAALVTQGVGLLGVENKDTSLEDYFLKLIGGGVHA